MEEIILNKLFEKVDLSQFEIPLMEENDLTYYQLRLLFTRIYQQSQGETKKVLSDILKITTKMSIMNKPLPTIKKMSNNSAKVFGK